MKNFKFALVVTGSVRAASEKEAENFLHTTFGIFSFVDNLKYKLNILVPYGKSEDSGSGKSSKSKTVLIDKKYKCPADDRHYKGELAISPTDCPYVGLFYCPFIEPELLADALHKNLLHCPYYEYDEERI